MYSSFATSFPRPPAKVSHKGTSQRPWVGPLNLDILLSGNHQRAVAIAFLNAFSQLGNIYGSYIWDKKVRSSRSSHGASWGLRLMFMPPSQYGPTYRIPYIVVICLFVVGILTAFAFRMQNAALNRRLDAGERAWQEQADVTRETARIEGLNDEEAANMKSGFRYYL